MVWLAYSRVPAEADPITALEAAREDLLGQRDGALEGQDAALRVRSTAVTDRGGTGLGLVVRVEGKRGGRAVRLSREVIATARRNDVPPLTLLAHALVAPEDLSPDWRPKRVGQGKLAPALLAQYRAVFRITEASEHARMALDAGKDVLLVGERGAGKSAIAGCLAADYLQRHDGMVWLSLTDPADGRESIVATLLETPCAVNAYLVVVDGLHVNAPVIRGVLGCVAMLRKRFGLPVRILATSWRSPDQLARWNLHWRFTTIPVEGPDLIRMLLAGSRLPDQQRDQIRQLAAGDVHLARTAMEICKATGTVPSQRELEEWYTRGVTDERHKHALYHLACLGVLGLELSQHDAEDLVPQAMAELCERELVTPSDGAYTIGHRRHAELVMHYARRVWRADERWGPPEMLIWQHLSGGGERLIKATLAQLDLFIPKEELREESRSLVSEWDLLGRLGRRLDRISRQDPEWGGRLSAAAFAATALARLGYEQTWVQVAERVRDRWRHDEPNPQLGSCADLEGVLRALGALRGQDRLLAGTPPPGGVRQATEPVDAARLRRNWALAMLLTLEGHAPAHMRDQQRINALVSLADRWREPEGYFHPGRLPWLTALVVYGLCGAGLRRDDPVVADACRWLLRPIPDGGPLDGWWPDGAGFGRSQEATTALCISALLRAGMPMNNTITAAYEWLREREDEWSRPGHETGLALVLEASLLCSYDTKTCHRHLPTLLRSVINELDHSALATGDVVEGSRVPFIGAQLARVVWTVMMMDFTTVVADAVNRSGYDLTESPAEPVRAAPAQSGPAQVRLVHLTEVQLTRWRDAGQQLRTKLEEQIDKRGVIPAEVHVPSVREELNRYLRHRAAYQRLIVQLGPATADAVLAELDELGGQVCGLAWPSLEPLHQAGENSG